MTASDFAILAFAVGLASACAEGYKLPPPTSTLEASVLAPTGGAAADPSMGGGGGAGGTAPPVGEPCTQNDMVACPCEGSDVQGTRICVFDMASPLQGFFSDCRGCPPPVDPGGMPAAGAGGMSGEGGMASSGMGGMSGTGAGTAGEPPADAGSIGEQPTEPVDDCEGVPEGTECDRDCILPSNTAHCNARGDCSCL